MGILIWYSWSWIDKSSHICSKRPIRFSILIKTSLISKILIRALLRVFQPRFYSDCLYIIVSRLAQTSSNHTRMHYSGHIWSIRPRMVFPLWDCKGLSSFLVHSELWGWPHLCTELDGNGFFLEITSTGNFLDTKKWKKCIQKGAHFSVFFGQKSGG